MLNKLKGVRVGHAEDREKLTGCTVVLFDDFYTATCEPRGGVPGSLFSDGLAPTRCSPTLNGLFIAGGGVAGLTVAARIYDFLRENGHGKQWGEKGEGALVPRIAGAVVADRGLFYGPIDPQLGYCACEDAAKNAARENTPLGNVGCGIGTTVGKFAFAKDGTENGTALFCKSGVGGASCDDLPGDLILSALTVVNAIGNVHDRDGSVIAGNRQPDSEDFVNFMDLIKDGIVLGSAKNPPQEGDAVGATTVSIVGTNADLGHDQLFRITQMAHSGIARAIRPAYTSLDGDMVFSFSTGEVKVQSTTPGRFKTEKFQPVPDWPDFSIDILGSVAAEVVFDSILSAVRPADDDIHDRIFGGPIPSGRSLE